MKLGLECEWGKSGSPNRSLTMVLDDASKLAAVRASVKVMIMATHTGGGSETGDFFRAVRGLREAWDDPAPWLLVNLPWGNDGSEWSPAQEVLPPKQ